MDRTRMDSPAIYRIRVQGRLDADWSSRFGGLNITESGTGASGIDTIIVGRLADQAQLVGLLNSLFDCQVPVKSIECLESE